MSIATFQIKITNLNSVHFSPASFINHTEKVAIQVWFIYKSFLQKIGNSFNSLQRRTLRLHYDYVIWSGKLIDQRRKLSAYLYGGDTVMKTHSQRTMIMQQTLLTIETILDTVINLYYMK